jgi:uncharacterized protein YxjI
MESAALTTFGPQAVARCFGEHQRLTVRQQKRWLEIIFNFEQKNRYEVFDEDQQNVLHVEEQGKGLWSTLKRLFLGPVRPFTTHVSDAASSELVLVVTRPFRFIFHRVEVFAGNGDKIGAIERRWSWIRRIYSIEDASGRPIAEIFGPFLKPWTFEIREHGQTVGAIRKRWSGFGKEMFTDADNFGVELDHISDPILRALAFAATILVDVVHFERAKG